MLSAVTLSELAGIVLGIVLNVVLLALLLVSLTFLRRAWRADREDARKGWGWRRQ